ncbi:MAG: hypothetical protein HAW60_04630, partial [Bdellovibrionales bacterium]|nr:hypothetical protein [Bdellovibrionales bacterium]
MNKLKTTLTQKYDFCFSHYFTECKPELKNLNPHQPDFEKSKHLHGHSVKIEVSVCCNDSFFSR